MMLLGVPCVSTFAIAVSILAGSAKAATLSTHRQDSEEAKTQGSILMRRAMSRAAEEGGKPHMHGEVLTMSSKDAQSKQQKKHRENKARGNIYSAGKTRLYVSFRAQDRLGDLCNDAYQEGPAGGNECADDKQQPMNDVSECHTAATEFCPDDDGDGVFDCVLNVTDMIIGKDNETDYPRGCFIKADDQMWYFNPTGLTPDSPTGTPVCVERAFVNGTDSSMDECPDGYSSIVNETTCRTAATCRGACTHQQFRILNADEEDTRPKGCHWDVNGCVSFNNKSSDPSCTTDCVGKPLCKVTVPYTGSSASPSPAGL